MNDMLTPESLLYIFIGIVLISTLFEEWLSYLNHKQYKKSMPLEVAPYYDQEAYTKAYQYHQDLYKIGRIKTLISTGIILLVLISGGFGWLDGQLRMLTEHPILLPLLYFGSLFFISDLLGLPFQLYHTFVIESRYDFNNTTLGTFIADKIKGYFLAMILGGLLMSIFLWLVNWLGNGFWIWFWIVMSGFTLILNIFYTSWILPLFNKLTPLENGELRSSLEAYSSRAGFPLDNIFVIDGSKRSKKANAFFSGLGKKKKVVLYDTLIHQHETDELVAVLAHEIGHYKKRHIIQGLFISVLSSGIMLFILSRLLDWSIISLALGADQWGIHLNLLGFGLLYSPISMILGIFGNALSRKNEFEADHYAADTFSPTPLQTALIRLHKESLSNLTPHPLYVKVNYSHPPLLERLKALDRIA